MRGRGGRWPPLRAPNGIVTKEKASQRRARGWETERFPHAGFPWMPQVKVSYTSLYSTESRPIPPSGLGKMVQWFKHKNKQTATSFANISCPLTSPPPPSPWGCLCSGLVYWNDNQSEQTHGFKVSRWTRLNLSHLLFSPALQERKQVLAHHFVSTVPLRLRVCAVSERPPSGGELGKCMKPEL